MKTRTNPKIIDIKMGLNKRKARIDNSTSTAATTISLR
jgi:hypothetical protein